MSAAADAIVVAGGSGERFGRSGGKQLAPVAGWPVLSWALRALDAVPEIGRLVVVRPASRAEEYAREAIDPLGLATEVVFADSGETRQESVASGLTALRTEASIVVVHDGARPLITPDLVQRTIDLLLAGEGVGVVVAHPSYDTLKVVDTDGQVVETPERSRYWQVQTPQVFDRRALEMAHAKAASEGFSGTDDASLVERAGGRVRVIEGPRDNIKVTVPEDLAYVQAVLGRRRDGGR